MAVWLLAHICRNHSCPKRFFLFTLSISSNPGLGMTPPTSSPVVRRPAHEDLGPLPASPATSEGRIGWREAFRAVRPSAGLARTLSKTVITTFGRDFAMASTLFHRTNAPGKVGRMTQTWVRFDGGWRIVVGHVSVIEEPASASENLHNGGRGGRNEIH